MAAWLENPDVPPPQGESLNKTARRIRLARDRILGGHAGHTVLVVSHVTPIKMLVRTALEAPVSSVFRMHLDLASFTEIAWYADGPAVLRTYNDTAHL
jgi:probable phosphoglycerate mutase